jgi:hypothetical protein
VYRRVAYFGGRIDFTVLAYRKIDNLHILFMAFGFNPRPAHLVPKTIWRPRNLWANMGQGALATVARLAAMATNNP